MPQHLGMQLLDIAGVAADEQFSQNGLDHMHRRQPATTHAQP